MKSKTKLFSIVLLAGLISFQFSNVTYAGNCKKKCLNSCATSCEEKEDIQTEKQITRSKKPTVEKRWVFTIYSLS